MNAYFLNRTLTRMFIRILSIVVILAMAYPATGEVYAQDPSPSVRAHPVWDSVDGWNWPQDAILHLTIEDPNTTTSPDLQMEMPGTVDPNLGSVWFDFAGVYDLKPGDEVALSDGTTTRNLVVSTHEITSVDLDADTVTGTAEPGTQVRLLVPAELFVTADENGNWLADFKQISVDLQPGYMMIAEVFDEDGDNSSFEFEIPNPFLVAAISQDWMWANGFHPETMVTISVYETKDSPDPVLVISRQSDASGNVNVEGWEHDWDLVPENYMVATDGTITDDLVMEYITLDVFDPETDFISGTTTPDRQVSIGVGGESGEYWMDVFSDPTGAWSGEFSSVFDITPDMWASGNIYDGDGDITAAHNSGPSGPPDFLLYNIYIFDPETGNVRQLTNLELAGEYDPTWSPNGKMIAHDVVHPDGSHGIYITDVKTGVSTPLIGAEDGGNDASWSPTGKWIAFDRRWYGEPNIYIVPDTGGGQIQVRTDAVHADWAPNGKRIVFQDFTDGFIGTIPVDGEKGIETLIASNGTEPTWSPDGNWIAYVFDGNLWKSPVNILGKVLGDPIQVTTLNGWDVGSPTWSTDSQTIFFTTGMNADLDIWSVPAAGGEITWFNGAPGLGDYNPANARNSSKIAYAGASADGQAARSWVANFSFDAGTWTEGDHSYYLEDTYSLPEPGGYTTDQITFNVTTDARMYNGYVLLRGGGLRARVGGSCPGIDPIIHPDQNTRFGYGWQTDYPMTYAEAVEHFISMVVKAHWDEGLSADLQRGVIIPVPSANFGEVVCSSTEAPEEPDLRILASPVSNQIFGYGWPTGSEVSLKINGEYIATSTVQGAPWDENDIVAFFDFGALHDLSAGDVVVLSGSDASSTRMMVVSSLRVTGFNLDSHTVYGVGDPNTEFIIADNGMPVSVDGDGQWSAAFDELTPGSWWTIIQGYADGNEVRETFRAPVPMMIAWKNWDGVAGSEWTPGADVTLTIDDPANGAGIDYTFTDAAQDSGNLYYGDVYFDLGIELQTGYVLTMSDGNFTKTLVLSALTVTGYDFEDRIIHGMGDPGTQLLVHLGGVESDTVTVGEDHTWAVHHELLQPGVWFDAIQSDDDGDQTRDGGQALHD